MLLDIMINEILPLLLHQDIWNYCLTCKQNKNIFSNKNIWKIKSQKELSHVEKYEEKHEEDTWIEYYLGELIPISCKGDHFGYIRFNHLTELIFPAIDSQLVLVDSELPIVKINNNCNKGQRIFNRDKDIALRGIDRAIVMDHSCFEIHNTSLFYAYDHPKKAGKEIYCKYQELIGTQLTSGIIPIYGYWVNKYINNGFDKNFRIMERLPDGKIISNYIDLYDDKLRDKKFNYLRNHKLDIKSSPLIDILEILKITEKCDGLLFEDICLCIISELKKINHILSSITID